MTEIREKAWAKLNISLDVAGKREDGYHDMVMVMQTVSLCDELLISLNSSGRVRASSNLHFIPGDERNLTVRAAMSYLEAMGKTGQGVRIDMRKNIPVGAGMAGGSADAAAVLRGMNALYGSALSWPELEELAAGVGSDVAFCVPGAARLWPEGGGSCCPNCRPCRRVFLLSASRSFPSPRRSFSESWTPCPSAATRTPPGSFRRWSGANWGSCAGGCTMSLKMWTTGA